MSPRPAMGVFRVADCNPSCRVRGLSRGVSGWIDRRGMLGQGKNNNWLTEFRIKLYNCPNFMFPCVNSCHSALGHERARQRGAHRPGSMTPPREPSPDPPAFTRMRGVYAGPAIAHPGMPYHFRIRQAVSSKGCHIDERRKLGPNTMIPQGVPALSRIMSRSRGSALVGAPAAFGALDGAGGVPFRVDLSDLPVDGVCDLPRAQGQPSLFRMPSANACVRFLENLIAHGSPFSCGRSAFWLTLTRMIIQREKNVKTQKTHHPEVAPV